MGDVRRLLLYSQLTKTTGFCQYFFTLCFSQHLMVENFSKEAWRDVCCVCVCGHSMHPQVLGEVHLGRLWYVNRI